MHLWDVTAASAQASFKCSVQSKLCSNVAFNARIPPVDTQLFDTALELTTLQAPCDCSQSCGSRPLPSVLPVPSASIPLAS